MPLGARFVPRTRMSGASPFGSGGTIAVLAAGAALLSLVAPAQEVQRGKEVFGSLKARRLGFFRELRFSPDGRYILATDDSGLTVLSVDPLVVLFRSPVKDPGLPEFTPDSRQVVLVSSVAALRADDVQFALVDSPARLERWSVSGERRVSSTEIPLHGCGAAALSPDGRTLGCDDLHGTLWLIDIGTGATIFRRGKFARNEVVDPDGTMAMAFAWGDRAEALPSGAHATAPSGNIGTSAIVIR